MNEWKSIMDNYWLLKLWGVVFACLRKCFVEKYSVLESKFQLLSADYLFENNVTYNVIFLKKILTDDSKSKSIIKIM